MSKNVILPFSFFILGSVWLWDRIPVGGGARFSAPVQTWGPPSLLYNGYRIFPGGKERLGRDADPSPLLVPWSRKSRAIPVLPLWTVQSVQSLSACTTVHFTFTYTSTPPMDRTACTEPQWLYRGAHYLFVSDCTVYKLSFVVRDVKKLVGPRDDLEMWRGWSPWEQQRHKKLDSPCGWRQNRQGNAGLFNSVPTDAHT